jgi:short-subunit dehydrogenase
VSAVQHGLEGVRLVLVTGGSSGIGKSFIESIRRVDKEVVICNLSRSDPESVSGGQNLIHRSCDLSDPVDRKAGADWALERIDSTRKPGKVLIINNAGFGNYGDFSARPMNVHLGMIETNVLAPVELVARLIPCLLERGGAVINIASIAACQPIPTMAVYAASKAFLLHWSIALSDELRSAGVDVLAVCPGPTRTAFSKRAGIEGRTQSFLLDQTADQVVREAWRALDGGKTIVVTGLLNKLIAAVMMRLPRTWSSRVAGRAVSRIRLAPR